MLTGGRKTYSSLSSAVWDESQKYALKYKLNIILSYFYSEGFEILKCLGYALLIQANKSLLLSILNQ